MASPYYVYSGAGGTNDGSSWTNAFTAFGSAVSAATTAGDKILVHKTHQEEVAADTTYTFSASVLVICVDKDASDSLAEMGTGGWIGNSTTNRSITFAGGGPVKHYGMTYRTAGATADSLTLYSSANAYEYEKCYFWNGNSATASRIALGGSAETLSFVLAKDCIFRFGSTAQRISIGDAKVIIEGGSVSSDGSSPTTLFENAEQGPLTEVEGFDAGVITGTLVGAANDGNHQYVFRNCKLGSAVVPLASQTYHNHASASVWLFNCSSGDEHYQMAHFNELGSTLIDTGIYANDNPTYDGTNKCSWKIVTSAYASPMTPYCSPFIDKYHSGTSAITPYFEIVRSGSATAYQDDEVWGEWTYQGTAGYPLSTFVNDRASLSGTPANQDASSKSGTDWTGENATSWFGKLSPTASITPAEIGHLRARVCVGEPSITVYVDPQIRGT